MAFLRQGVKRPEMSEGATISGISRTLVYPEDHHQLKIFLGRLP